MRTSFAPPARHLRRPLAPLLAALAALAPRRAARPAAPRPYARYALDGLDAAARHPPGSPNPRARSTPAPRSTRRAISRADLDHHHHEPRRWAGGGIQSRALPRNTVCGPTAARSAGGPSAPCGGGGGRAGGAWRAGAAAKASTHLSRASRAMRPSAPRVGAGPPDVGAVARASPPRPSSTRRPSSPRPPSRRGRAARVATTNPHHERQAPTPSARRWTPGLPRRRGVRRR